jgi:peptidoglycan hydrolase-like protein with peptidoglycan-binding domain
LPELVAATRAQAALQAQRRLQVDGNFGSETARALQVFLTRKGLNPGKIDGVFGTKAKRALQEFLRARGHEVGKVDAFFGPRSVMALQRWLRDGAASPQASGRLNVDGIWGNVTSRSLQQALNAELGASSTTSTSTSASSPASIKRVNSSASTVSGEATPRQRLSMHALAQHDLKLRQLEQKGATAGVA